MKFALVELNVDLEGITAPSQTDAVLAGIRRDTNRNDASRTALQHARSLHCQFVEFPGWTIVANHPPSWVAELSSGLTVVIECLRPDPDTQDRKDKVKGDSLAQISSRAKERASTDHPGQIPPVWESFVIRDKVVLIGPVRQYVASAGDPWEGEELSNRGEVLVRALQAHGPSGRRFVIPSVGDAQLWLCGEVNIVGGGGGGRGPEACYHYQPVADAGLTENTLARIQIIANPAHTSSKLQALRDKRAWLSRSGLLLHTANTHTAGWELEWEGGCSKGQASYKTAMAWSRGETCDLESHEGDGYILKTLEWQP